jgi:hypothetical protein
VRGKINGSARWWAETVRVIFAERGAKDLHKEAEDIQVTLD